MYADADATTSAYDLVFDAYFSYLRHLNSGGERFRLPEKTHNPALSVGLVHPSALGSCPLKPALQRANVPETNPPNDYEQLSAWHLMRQGVQDAEPLQEALIWKYEFMPGHYATAEESITDETLGIRGRMDAFVFSNGARHIYEIKRRDSYGKYDQPQPKISDVWQVLTYGVALGVKSLNIILLDRYFFNLWQLRPVDEGYVLFNYKTGEKWDSILNTPEFINVTNLKAEIERQRAYLLGYTTEKPIADMLNDERTGSWFCWKWAGDKAKMYAKTYQGRNEKIGHIQARCPYFTHCYGHAPGARLAVRETAYQSNTFEFVKETEENHVE